MFVEASKLRAVAETLVNVLNDVFKTTKVQSKNTILGVCDWLQKLLVAILKQGSTRERIEGC